MGDNISWHSLHKRLHLRHRRQRLGDNDGRFQQEDAVSWKFVAFESDGV